MTGDAGAEGMVASAGRAAPGPAAGRTGNGLRGGLHEAPDGLPDGTASALDDALLRDIAETPAVSSDSIGIDIPSGPAAGRSRGPEAPVHEAGAGAETLSSRESGPPVDAASPDPASAGTGGAPEVPPDGRLAPVEAPGSHAGAAIDEEGPGSPAAWPAGSADGAGEEPADAEVGPVVRTSASGVLPPSHEGAGADGSLPGRTADAVAGSSGGNAESTGPRLSGIGETSARNPLDAPEPGEDDEVHKVHKVHGTHEARGEEHGSEPGAAASPHARAQHGDRGAFARAHAAGPAPVDVLLRDIAEAPCVSSDETGMPVSAAGVASRESEADADIGAPAEPELARRTGEPVEPDAEAGPDEAEYGLADATDPSEGAGLESARLEDTAGPVPAGPEDTDVVAGRVPDDRRDARGDAPGDASSLPEPAETAAPGAGSPPDPTDPEGPATAVSSDDSVGANEADDTGTEEGAGSVIHLPDLSGMPASEADAGDRDALLRRIADVVAESAGESTGSPDADCFGPDVDASAGDAHGTRAAPGRASAPEHGEDTPAGADRDEAAAIALPGPGGLEDAADPAGIEDGGEAGAACSGDAGLGARAAAGAAGAVAVDVLLRDIAEAPTVSSDETVPALAASVRSRSGDADADTGTRTGPDPALRIEESVEPAAAGSLAEARGAGEATDRSEWTGDGAGSGDSAGPVRTGPEDTDGDAGRIAGERLHARGDPTGASSLREPPAPLAGSPMARPGPEEPAFAGWTEDAAGADDGDDAGIEGGAGSVIHLPDLSGMPASEADADDDDALLRQIADAVAESAGKSAGEAAGSPASAFPVSGDPPAGSPAASSARAGGAAPDDMPSDDAAVIAFPGLAEAAAPDRAVGTEGRGEPGGRASGPADGAGTAAATAGIVFDDTLALDLAGVEAVSSDGSGSPESAFDISLPDRESASAGAAGGGDDAGFADLALEAAPPGPAAALAFATDSDTETALRDGLLGFAGASAAAGEPQVWQGGLRAAVAALGEGRSAPLVIVDIDGLPYPAGAIHELAAVCEVGTVVVAVGSDASARPGRELLLAGVSDYLAKPLTAEAVRRVASHALADGASRPGGLVACFAGCGGSGATTLATATALQAASRGCYVSVLDLSRSVPAAALGLGVDPVAGLDQLLETADKLEVDADALDGVCARRSDRIEVYAHRWGLDHPAPASAEAVDRLLAVLRQRSQVVIVDGLDEAGMRFLPSAETDARVFVAEPTAERAPHLGRMLGLLPQDRPVVLVRNHTRSFGRNGGAGVLGGAAPGVDPDVTVPFDPAVPETADWGWPQGRLPRSLRKPVGALTDRLLGASPGAGAAPLGAARAA